MKRPNRDRGRRNRGRQAWTGRLRQLISRSNLLLRASALLFLIVLVVMLTSVRSDADQQVALRIFAVLVLAFLPGWLFLRFVTVRACSVWDEFVLNLHRLAMDRPQHLPEPPVNSFYHGRWEDAGGADRSCERNLYRDKFEAHYGKGTTRDERDRDAGAKKSEGALLKAETYFPVFLSTAVFAVGWSAVLSGSSLLPVPPEGMELSSMDLLRLGFMGAYLFTLQMLVRRYFQADLKASAYVNAVTRVVSALVLVRVVDIAILHGDAGGGGAAVAFIIGFFPLVGLQALQKTAALVLRTVVPTLRNAYPLSDLDGLSVWYEARLLELGIEDMQNLATANLVDVTLHSRVPVARLVDWVDQAHLYLHLEPSPGPKRKQPRRNTSRETLRRLGIRTATDLEQALTPCEEGTPSIADGLVRAEANQQLLDDLRMVLNEKAKGPSVTTSIVKALRNDTNLIHVRAWKRNWTADDEHVAQRPTGPSTPSIAPANGLARPVNGQVLRRVLAPLGALTLRR